MDWWNVPGTDGLDPKPSNKFITEELPKGDDACAEGDTNLSNKSTELLPF